ncbi:MAG: KH domain-containing protein [Candidatus Babeliales bacterium]
MMLKEFVEYIVGVLIGDKQEVNVQVTQKENGASVIIYVSKADIGKVIGKGGKTIKSIRSSLAALTSENIAVDVFTKDA